MNFEHLIDTFQNHPLPDKRRQAADDLISNKMYNEITIKAFAHGLLDTDIGIRDVCQRALLDTPDEFKTVAAIAVAPYINMREIELRNLSGEILTRLGEPTIPVLVPYLKSNDFDVRKFACDILGLIGNDSTVQYIVPLLNDTDKNALLSAIETLGNLSAESALDSLIMVYENFEIVKSFDEVKPFIIEAIGKIGGENAESYLLEQLKKETELFLQSAIIDALAFNTKHLEVSYKLLEIMPTSKSVELQKIMLTTAFAIAFRLEESLIMPNELRHVSYTGMKENDSNIMTASVISLGDSYQMNDIQPLIDVIFRIGNSDDADLNKQILYNLTVGSSTDVLLSFFESYFV
jgi:hypothetical protein